MGNQSRNTAKRKAQRQWERKQAAAAAARQRWIVIGVVVAVILIAGGIWFVTQKNTTDSGNQSTQGDVYSSADTSYDDSSATDESPVIDSDSSPSEAPTNGAAGTALCAYPEGRPAAKDVGAPAELNPPTSGSATATVTLNGDQVTFELDYERTPCTTNSFVSLAEQGYFDDITCHRLTTADSLQVLQCGDPSGSGAGGPGYSFADELDGTETYLAGTLAMANAGPDTNGSQFFIVYADSQLPPSYTVFGQVTAGLDVVEDIAAAGIAGGGHDGAPADPVTIGEVKIS